MVSGIGALLVVKVSTCSEIPNLQGKSGMGNLGSGGRVYRAARSTGTCLSGVPLRLLRTTAPTPAASSSSKVLAGSLADVVAMAHVEGEVRAGAHSSLYGGGHPPGGALVHVAPRWSIKQEMPVFALLATSRRVSTARNLP